jgi:hypothetical protein
MRSAVTGKEGTKLSSESIVGLVAALSALVGAIFTGLVALRRERREVATADVLELRAYRDAWLWAVRTIYSLLIIMGRADIPEPPDVRDELNDYQERIDNPVAYARKET